MGFEKDFKKIIEGSIGIAVKTASELSDKTGVNQASLSMFLSGKRKNLNLESVAKILDFLGATIHTPDSDPTREVVFVNPRVHQDYSGLPIPTPDDYRAIPLTSAQVAAGPGLVNDSSELKSWVLVYTGEWEGTNQEEHSDKYHSAKFSSQCFSVSHPTFLPVILFFFHVSSFARLGGLFLRPQLQGQKKFINNNCKSKLNA